MKKMMLLAFVIVGLVLLASQLIVGQDHERRIVLSGSGDDCGVTTVPTRIDGANRGQSIHWRVVNNCDDAVTVTVDNFKHRDANDQIKTPLDILAAPEVPGNQQRVLRARVRQGADLGTYKYDILMDGQVAVDPDLIIR